jgi:ABC-2 type transport system ATP-binding protein
MRRRRISALSKGYKQRVGIAQAILGDPKVIILDEPTVGLDPIQIIEIRDLIRQLGQEHTVILSSHILSEVQTICDKILIIAHGRLIAFDETENLEQHLVGSGEIVLTAEAGEDETRSLIGQVEHITGMEMEAGEDGLTAARLQTDSDDIYAVSKALFFAFAGAGKALVELTVKKATLEDVFIELTENAPDQADQGGEAPAGGPSTDETTEESEVTEE